MSVAIVGVGQTGYRRAFPQKSSRDLIYEAASLALADAGMDIDGIDMVLSGVAPDALSGEVSVERTAMLGFAKPFLRINTGGVTGSSTVFAANSFIRARRARAVLVVGLERMGQATSSQQVFNTIFDPVYEKDFPLTTITMAALRASMLMRLYGYTAMHWAQIAARSFRNALNNPLAHLHLHITPQDVLDSPILAWPIHRYEACPMSEGACAMVLVDGKLVGRRTPAWIQGAASVTDSYAMGDRIHRPGATLVDLLSLKLAARRAYADAGVDKPRQQLLGLFQRGSHGLPCARLLRGRRRAAFRRGSVHRCLAACHQPVGRPARCQPGQCHRHGTHRRSGLAGARHGRRPPGCRRRSGRRHRPGRRHPVFHRLRARPQRGRLKECSHGSRDHRRQMGFQIHLFCR
jgi:acetyl-CoA C-acetyltransferase